MLIFASLWVTFLSIPNAQPRKEAKRYRETWDRKLRRRNRNNSDYPTEDPESFHALTKRQR